MEYGIRVLLNFELGVFRWKPSPKSHPPEIEEPILLFMGRLCVILNDIKIVKVSFKWFSYNEIFFYN